MKIMIGYSTILAATSLAGVLVSQPAQDIKTSFIPTNEFFVGLDMSKTLDGGSYKGMKNPNYNRLVFLYGHQYDGSGEVPASSSHFHSKGLLYYKGSKESAVLAPAGGNVLPESKTHLNLLPGSGSLSQYLVSGQEKVACANLTLRPMSWLNRPGAKEWEKICFKGWTEVGSSLAKARLVLEVVSLSNGLILLKPDGTIAAAKYGDQVALGTGDFAFTPLFAVKKDASPGPHSAHFLIRDVTGTHLESGVVEVRFHVGPQ